MRVGGLECDNHTVDRLSDGMVSALQRENSMLQLTQYTNAGSAVKVSALERTRPSLAKRLSPLPGNE